MLKRFLITYEGFPPELVPDDLFLTQQQYSQETEIKYYKNPEQFIP